MFFLDSQPATVQNMLDGLSAPCEGELLAALLRGEDANNRYFIHFRVHREEEGGPWVGTVQTLVVVKTGTKRLVIFDKTTKEPLLTRIATSLDCTKEDVKLELDKWKLFGTPNLFLTKDRRSILLSKTEKDDAVRMEEGPGYRSSELQSWWQFYPRERKMPAVMVWQGQTMCRRNKHREFTVLTSLYAEKALKFALRVESLPEAIPLKGQDLVTMIRRDTKMTKARFVYFLQNLVVKHRSYPHLAVYLKELPESKTGWVLADSLGANDLAVLKFFVGNNLPVTNGVENALAKIFLAVLTEPATKNTRLEFTKKILSIIPRTVAQPVSCELLYLTFHQRLVDFFRLLLSYCRFNSRAGLHDLEEYALRAQAPGEFVQAISEAIDERTIPARGLGA